MKHNQPIDPGFEKTTGRSSAGDPARKSRSGRRLLLTLILAVLLTALLPFGLRGLVELRPVRPIDQTAAAGETGTSQLPTTVHGSESTTGSASSAPIVTGSSPGSPPDSTPATTAPTAMTPPTWHITTDAELSADLAPYSAARLGWSYRRPTEPDRNEPASLTDNVANLIAPFDVYWQLPAARTARVYLTMDEGYEYQDNTLQILDILRGKDVHVTFFITGDYLRQRPDNVKTMVADGHQVCNHTMKHPDLVELLEQKGTDAVLSELRGLEQQYTEVTGVDMPRLVRPPMGSYSERLLALLNREGYRPVFWSFAYRDWLTDDQPDPAKALQLILGELHDGSVILLHAVSTTNVAILPALIDDVRARGYEFAALPQP